MIEHEILPVYRMRAGKVLGFLVGGVIAVMVLGLLSVWLFVNPNLYKAKIAAAVREGTGRELRIQGDIKLSVLPWIALEVGPATLGNPAGFDAAAPFASFRHAAVRARLWPLLQQRLVIARVEVDGLEVRLQKNAAGVGNWEGLGRVGDVTPAAGAAGDAGKVDSARAAATPLEGLAGVKITHGRLTYGKVVLENLLVETAPFADGVVPISIQFDANRGVPTEHAAVDAQLDLAMSGAKRWRLAPLNALGHVYRAGQSRGVRWNLNTPDLVIDLEAQTLVAPIVALTVAGAQLNGTLQGTKIVDDLHLAGSVTLAPLLIREFLPRWGLTSPATRDPRVLSQVSGSGTYEYGGDGVRLGDLQLVIDDTRVRGSAAVEHLQEPALAFDVTADRIDLDRYRAPEGQPGDGPVSAAAAGSEGSLAPGDAGSRPLEVSGTVAVGTLHMEHLDVAGLRLTVAAREGVTRVFPLQAQVDGGRYSGDITYDSRGAVPVLSVDEHLSGADMGKLLASAGKSVHLSGKGNFTVKATGQGASEDAILRTLNGRVDASVSDGAVEGIDLGYQLARAESFLNGGKSPGVPDTHVTRFDGFKLSADIVNGIAQTKDLLISSPALRVTGQGSTNLMSKAIDFDLLADTLRSVQGVPIQIPVSVTGTTSKPEVRPDIERFAKGQLRQKLRDVLHDKLQGLFGKP